MSTGTSGLTITGLGRASGVTRETIRFYEQRGLLLPPPRSANGYRCYSSMEARRTRFIRSAQALGFSLEQVATLLAMRASPGNACSAVKAQAEAKIADIEIRIAALNAMKKTLVAIAADCEGGGAALDECPILAALDADAKGSTT